MQQDILTGLAWQNMCWASPVRVPRNYHDDFGDEPSPVEGKAMLGGGRRAQADLRRLGQMHRKGIGKSFNYGTPFFQATICLFTLHLPVGQINKFGSEQEGPQVVWEGSVLSTTQTHIYIYIYIYIYPSISRPAKPPNKWQSDLLDAILLVKLAMMPGELRRESPTKLK